MKIQKLKINNYGKIKNQEIQFGNHINIIYGNNEAGKSTILKYIINSLYGISKNKKGKEYSDFERYEPWNGEEFSGKLIYQLDNGEIYEIYRDFKKKNPKIFNQNMEDISKQFPIDKTIGNTFFYEQTKVDEQLFLATLVTNQQEACLQKNEQGILIQKIANLVGTGEDNVSYKIAINRINKKQLEEIGTSRTREKPMNIIDNKINKLEQEKEELQKYKEKQYIIEEESKKINEEIKILDDRHKELKELKILYEEKTLQKEKILLKEEIRKQNQQKIKEIDINIEEIHIQNKNLLEEYENKINIEEDINVNIVENENTKKETENINKKENKSKFINNTITKIIITTIAFIIINILQFILLKNININYAILLISIISIVILSNINIKKQQKKQQEEYEQKQKQQKEQQEREKQIEEEILIKKQKIQTYKNIKEKINLLENEINILEKNNEEINKQIQQMEIENEEAFKQKKEEIVEKYKQIQINTIAEQNIKYEIESIQNKINNKRIELHKLEIDKNNILPKLETLAQIEEKYVNYCEQKQELEKLNTAISIAKQTLEECYEKMRHTIAPKFTENLSKNISEITKGKYSNVYFNDEKGLIVENENGEYVSASRLSVGTIEQLYISLRLSMVEELSNEKLPIILDEVFAYFDEERLKNFLLYINQKYYDRQILIFTCTQREKDILERNGIKYDTVELT